MKKIASILIVILLICVFCTPAFAEDAPAPTEISPGNNGVIQVTGNRIISQPNEVQATALNVASDSTLTIAENVTVEVGGDDRPNYNEGTIIVYGTLNLTGPYEGGDINKGMIVVYGTLIVSEEWEPFVNSGTIIVYGTLVSGVDDLDGKLFNDEAKVILADCCGGEMIGEFYNFWEEPEHVDHYYINGVCGCGALDPSAAGFTLSGGNWWIIIAGAVVILGGIAAAVLVAKKRKKE